MYRCCNAKRFLKLLCCDIAVIALVSVFVNTSGCFDTSGVTETERVLPTIMYHSVSDVDNGPYVVSPKALESDLNWLDENGFESVLPSQLADFAAGRCDLPEKPVMLTFDDGCYNNLFYVLPLLEKYDFCAVVSVVGEYTDIMAPNDPGVPDYSYLTWDDISTLVQSGRIEIGNHTYALHKASGARKGCAICAGESEESYSAMLAADIGLLQSEIKKHTGISPICFAYPFGYDCAESAPVLRELGFSVTLGCREKLTVIKRGDMASLERIGRFNRANGFSTATFMERLLSEYPQD